MLEKLLILASNLVMQERHYVVTEMTDVVLNQFLFTGSCSVILEILSKLEIQMETLQSRL